MTEKTKAARIRDAREAKTKKALALIVGGLDILIALGQVDVEQVQPDLVAGYTDTEWRPIEDALGKRFSETSRRLTAQKFRAEILHRQYLAAQRAMSIDELVDVN